MGVWGREHVKIWDPLFISATVELQIWYTAWAWGVAYRETTFTMKIVRGPG